MSELPVGTAQTAGDERHSRQQVRMIRFAKLWLIGMATTLLLGIGSAFAICPCGDDICGGNSYFPPETPQSCPADCGDPLPPPVELMVRVTVVPFDDPGQFNIHVVI